MIYIQMVKLACEKEFIMKKVLLTLLAVFVILGALAGVGFAGYRIGYVQGAASDGSVPSFVRPERMNPSYMPGVRRDFGFWNQPYYAPMMGRGIFGFTYFSPFRILWNLAVLALIVWFVYWLFTRSGWRITRQANREQGPSSSGPDV